MKKTRRKRKQLPSFRSTQLIAMLRIGGVVHPSVQFPDEQAKEARVHEAGETRRENKLRAAL